MIRAAWSEFISHLMDAFKEGYAKFLNNKGHCSGFSSL